MVTRSRNAPPPNDPDQSKRFEETARELAADQSGKSFKRALKRVMPKPPKKR